MEIMGTYDVDEKDQDRHQTMWIYNTEFEQCCGTGIRCLFDPGWVKNSIRIRDEQPGSYFRKLKKTNF
jgi:hypothetical protein